MNPIPAANEVHERSGSGEQRAAKYGRAVRRGLRVLAICAVVLMVGIAAAVWLIPSERIARAASARAEAALGLPVEVGGVELDLWPVPAVALEGLRLGEGERPVAWVERVLLRPRLRPLLSGRVSVDEIAFEQPLFRVDIDSAGHSNLPFPADSAPPASTGRDIDFAVDEFRVEDGRLVFRDARDGTVLDLNGIQQRLRIEGWVREGELARIGLGGSLSIDSVGARLPGRLAVPLRGMRIAVAHEGLLDREADRLALGSLRLEIERMVLEGSGRIEALGDSVARRVALELRTGEFSADDLARSLPEGLLPALLAGGETEDSPPGGGAERPEIAGRALVQARIEGPVTADSLPRIEGSVRLSDVSMELRDHRVLSAAEGVLAFSRDSLATSGLRGRLFGEPFRLAFRVENFAAPVAAFSTTGILPLADLVAIAEKEDSLSASGQLPFDLRGRIHSAEPARSELEGTVGLRDIRLATETLLQPISITGGQLSFAGSTARVDDLQAAFGESRVAVDATAEGWLAAVLDSTRVPAVRFDLHGGLLDLDALLGESESEYVPLFFARLADRPVDGRSAAEAAAQAGLSLPELPNIEATGRVRAERLVRSGLEYRNLDARAEVSPDAVVVHEARFDLMGGPVAIDLAFQSEGDAANLLLDYKLTDVGAEPFFSRLTPFRGHFSGALDLEGSVAMQLDENLLPVRPSVRAEGTILLTGGELTNWPLLAAVGERLGVARFDTLAFRSWEGEYSIVGPLVTLERSVQAGERVDAELAGSFDFGGHVDLGVLARLSPQLSARAAEPIRQVALATAGEDGGVPIGRRITGSVAAPVIALDLAAARRNAVASAREAAEREAREIAARTAQKAAERVLPDSLSERAGRTGEALRSGLGDRLRGVLPGAQKPASPADSTGSPANQPPSEAVRDSASSPPAR